MISLADKFKDWPDFLSSSDLVELGLYKNPEAVYYARISGQSPDFIKMARRVLYIKSSVISFLEDRLKYGYERKNTLPSDYELTNPVELEQKKEESEKHNKDKRLNKEIQDGAYKSIKALTKDYNKGDSSVIFDDKNKCVIMHSDEIGVLFEHYNLSDLFKSEHNNEWNIARINLSDFYDSIKSRILKSFCIEVKKKRGRPPKNSLRSGEAQVSEGAAHNQQPQM